MDSSVLDSPNAVAIIGMAGRFPGARNLEQFWHNLEQGVESVTFFSDKELLDAGVLPELLNDPDYVKAAPILEDVDQFDAKFFHCTPREAEITDPQHRIFLECAWEALENAGYCGETYDGAIGVFAGAGPSMTSYLASDTHVTPKLFGPAGGREHIGNDKDYLSTRVSYKLNLRGPSLTVQSACSTSLVAVHLACQSLLMNESDIVLAGGVTIRVPQKKGYLSRGDAMASPDGHCRAFDADAQGTNFGSGVGIVVLKRLSEAVRDGDVIHAVLRGSAINNDGAGKISYWASSAEGLQPAILEAMAVAQVHPETIGYVEAHGTGTSIGDPVEIMALTRAFRKGTQKTGYCPIGSVKTNIGHLDSAAGIAGLLKTILALKHKVIPPTLHFQKPNPRIPFAETPFYVNTERREWKRSDTPRRAAVNALGIGGTNAHLVLEEAPACEPVENSIERSRHLLPLSAKNEKALRELASRYVEYLDSCHADSQPNLADICYTAATGRAAMLHRLCIEANSLDQMRQRLNHFLEETPDAGLFAGKATSRTQPQIAYHFQSEETFRPNLARQLYDTQPTFRKIIERCAKLVLAECGKLLLPALFLEDRREEGKNQPPPLPTDSHASALPTDSHASAALCVFCLEYALAELWKEWGITPAFVMGQNLGEITAACVAGLYSLPDALRIVHADPAQRAAMMEAIRHTDDATSATKPTIPIISGELFRMANSEDQPSEVLNLSLSQLQKKLDFVLTMGLETGAGCELIEKLGVAHATSLPGLPDHQSPSTQDVNKEVKGDAWTQILANLAVLFVHRAPIRWDAFDRDYARRRVELPTYPFQRKRFWAPISPVMLAGIPGGANASSVPLVTPGSPSSAASLIVIPTHPLLGRRVDCAFQPEAIIFESCLDTNHPLWNPLAQTEVHATDTTGEKSVAWNEALRKVAFALAEVAAGSSKQGQNVEVSKMTLHNRLPQTQSTAGESAALSPLIIQSSLVSIAEKEGVYTFRLDSRKLKPTTTDGPSNPTHPSSTWTPLVSAQVQIS